mmetsp:Transcript_38058/g.51487  ORF Transcript_38058/g.51487 Transcript_38058/m.51487 type:complete len:230 (-) Transcript_38058:243-932(-)
MLTNTTMRLALRSPCATRGAFFGRSFSSTINPDQLISRPSIQTAKEMPQAYSHMSNIVVTHLAASGDEQAVGERLIRDIMKVDECSYTDANVKLDMIRDACNDHNTWNKLPYQIGAFTAYTAAFVSIPLCFHLDTAIAFNDNFVTTEMPPAKDLETWLEVGSWTWAWMEPPLGQVSFFLLTLQLARRQMVTAGIKPFTSFMNDRRAAHICQLYPRYNEMFLSQYAANKI